MVGDTQEPLELKRRAAARRTSANTVSGASKLNSVQSDANNDIDCMAIISQSQEEKLFTVHNCTGSGKQSESSQCSAGTNANEDENACSNDGYYVGGTDKQDYVDRQKVNGWNGKSTVVDPTAVNSETPNMDNGTGVGKKLPFTKYERKNGMKRSMSLKTVNELPYEMDSLNRGYHTYREQPRRASDTKYMDTKVLMSETMDTSRAYMRDRGGYPKLPQIKSMDEIHSLLKNGGGGGGEEMNAVNESDTTESGFDESGSSSTEGGSAKSHGIRTQPSYTTSRQVYVRAKG